MVTETDDGIRKFIDYASGNDDELSDSDEQDENGRTTTEIQATSLDGDESSESALENMPLSDDPVRMYLKEIGQVPLLDSNREMWLSTQIAAERHLEALRDELMSLDTQAKVRTEANYLDVERFAYRRLRDDWGKLEALAAEKRALWMFLISS